MNQSEIRLDKHLLARFESALIEVAPGYEHGLAPGLDSAAIGTITSELPGELPVEARTWWGWRNGLAVTSTGELPAGVSDIFGFGNFRLSSLQECVAAYVEMREEAAEMSREEAELFAPADWFPIDESATVSLRLGTGTIAVSSLLDSDGYSNRSGEEIATSFGQWVSWWTEALEKGGLVFDPKSGWEYEGLLLPPGLRLWALGAGWRPDDD
jgi:hypothetical protein